MKNNSILKYLIYGGLFLVPFIPLIVSSSMYFPFITGKNFAFRFLVEIITGLWAILAVRDGKYRPKFSMISWSVLVFVAVIALADGFGVYPYKSFWSNYERMEGLVTLLHLLGLFFVASSILKTEKLWSRFFHTSIAASVILGVYGLFQLSGAIAINQGGVRVDGTLGNATYLAVYMLFHIFLTAFFLTGRYYDRRGARGFFKDYVNYIYGAIIVLQAVMLYYTASRGPVLGLIGGIFIGSILVIIFEKEKKSAKKAAIIALAAIIAIIGFFIVFRDSDFVRNSNVLSRFSAISAGEQTTRSRFMIWNMAYQGFKERPILGWGQENFNYVFNKYYNPKMFDQEQWFDRTHNVFFDWLIAGGSLGVLSYLSIFFAAIYLLWKKEGWGLSAAEKSVFTGMLFGYFFQNLFVFDNITSYVLFFSVIAYGHSRKISQSANLPVKKEIQINSLVAGWIIVPATLVLALFSIYFFNYKAYSASLALIEAMTPYDGVTKNLESFKKALAYGSFGDSEIREQLVQTVMKIATSDASPQIKQAFFDLTVSEMKKQLAKTPDDARYHLFTGSMLTAFKQYDEGLKGLQRASELSPNKQTIRFELIGNLINSGKAAEALKTAKETFELETSSNPSRIVYAITAIYAKDNKLADELLAPIQDTAFADDRIISAYAATKQYEKIIPIFQAKVKGDPNNIQNHFSLAAAYLGNGQREIAVAEIQKIIEINPKFKQQGEFYVKEIRAGRNP
ncbi:MAG: O-antigen ligase family protein [Patescibacteria group bacterium]|nr:O-antigen ligase family protein [Patescibacteria group bacterium]MDE1988314.1 O-antigen ligase family protein [Patescibacteria group bacterium]MDE2218321.1 O-antigen ligase family protein [Patescibacteria group bacterium]